MPSELRAFLPLLGDPRRLVQVFAGDPGSWLPDAERKGPGRWIMTVRAGAWARRVDAQVGKAWRSGRSRWRTLSWDPLIEEGGRWPIERLLPSLDGEIGLHVVDDAITLMLDGRYRPPGGALGTAIDRAGLHLVARSTGERLLADIAADLSALAPPPEHGDSARRTTSDGGVAAEGEPEASSGVQDEGPGGLDSDLPEAATPRTAGDRSEGG